MPDRPGMSYVVIGTVTLVFTVLVLALVAFTAPTAVVVRCERATGQCTASGVNEGAQGEFPLEALGTARLRLDDDGRGRRIAVDGPRGLVFLSSHPLSDELKARHAQVVEQLKAYALSEAPTLDLSYPVGGGLSDDLVWSGLAAGLLGGGFLLRGLLRRAR